MHGATTSLLSRMYLSSDTKQLRSPLLSVIRFWDQGWTRGGKQNWLEKYKTSILVLEVIWKLMQPSVVLAPSQLFHRRVLVASGYEVSLQYVCVCTEATQRSAQIWRSNTMINAFTAGCLLFLNASLICATYVIWHAYNISTNIFSSAAPSWIETIWKLQRTLHWQGELSCWAHQSRINVTLTQTINCTDSATITDLHTLRGLQILELPVPLPLALLAELPHLHASPAKREGHCTHLHYTACHNGNPSLYPSSTFTFSLFLFSLLFLFSFYTFSEFNE